MIVDLYQVILNEESEKRREDKEKICASSFGRRGITIIWKIKINNTAIRINFTFSSLSSEAWPKLARWLDATT